MKKLNVKTIVFAAVLVAMNLVLSRVGCWQLILAPPFELQ